MGMRPVVWVLMAGAGMGCRPSDVLSVPAPAGVLASAAVRNQTGAEGAFNAAKAQLFQAADGWWLHGLLTWSELLTDEFVFSGITAGYGSYANVDARVTMGGAGFIELIDTPWENLLQARSQLLIALPGLTQYEPPSGQSKTGEAYALAGYAELLLAEDYCAGTPLTDVLPGGTIRYGMPLSTDSLLGAAVVLFDSAVAHANGDPTVAGLASVGLGRALLDRGEYVAAAAAVHGISTSFVYNVELEPKFSGGAAQQPNAYAAGISISFFRMFNVADQEGENGLNFVSAQDPRLVLDSSLTNDDGGAWYVPTKFEANLTFVPLATGIEARLIEAEAALRANNVTGWAADLNALRADAPDTKVAFPPATQSLTPDSTILASAATQVDVMFRERAFWLYGMGTRLGDLRRLIRQYGRDQSVVFPVGPYEPTHQSRLPSPIPSYGTDVNLTVPTPYGLSSNGIAETNPNYKGCIASTKTA